MSPGWNRGGARRDHQQRLSTLAGPPTPDDLDSLITKVWKQPAFFLTHPDAIAAFGRECTRRGTPPPTVSLFGSQFVTCAGCRSSRRTRLFRALPGAMPSGLPPGSPPRLLSGGGVVEPDQLLPVHPLGQDREVPTDRVQGADAEEVIFVRGTTEAINLVAATWGRQHLGEGDEIVISHLEHHANIVPWQLLAQECGFTIKVIPVDDRGQLLLDQYARSDHRADQAGLDHPGVQRARHGHPGPGGRRGRPPPWCPGADRRCAVGRRTCRSTCTHSTSTSSSSPGTRSSDRPGSVPCTANGTCSRTCRPTRAAAT